MRDFMAIMQQHGYWRDERWSKTEYTYTFETGSKLEFFSADQPSKVRGPRRDRLFINEANNIPHEAFDQLAVRTREYIWLDYNPTNEFWWYTDVMPHREDYDFLTVTYKDNEGRDPNIVADIESHRPNKAWWRVYGEGKLGETEGRIFTDWAIIDEIPHEAKLEARGLDFGYARDPDALCDIYSYNGGYIIDELLYRVGMKDRQLADLILNQPDPNVLTVADSADQKAIDLLREHGVNIIGVEKKGFGGDKFTKAAIKYVQGQRVSVTKRSTNYIKSYRNFMWQTDRDGKIIDKYDHFWSDGMMSVIYGMQSFRPREEEDYDQYKQMTSFAL
jgi:phage terminase large subunit